MDEPTLRDVLTAVDGVRTETRGLQDDVAGLRVSLRELRMDWAERWSRTNERLDDIRRRVETLTGELADFHRDYNEHHHPHRHGDDGQEIAA